jgi:hypothetical protein
LDELYKQYGQLLIQAEILQSKIQEVKAKIANELNKSISPASEDAQVK